MEFGKINNLLLWWKFGVQTQSDSQKQASFSNKNNIHNITFRLDMNHLNSYYLAELFNIFRLL